jgi:hypothetical protein
MVFGRRLTRLRLMRLSLAEVLLADTELKAWLVDFYADHLKRRSYELRETALKGHPGVELRGRPWLLVNPLRLVGLPRETDVNCWHCEETNRIMICGFDGPSRAADVFEPVYDSFACCAEEE